MQLIKYQHIAFWDAASYIQLPNAVVHKYPLVKLQEIITLRKDFIKIHDEVEYKRCKVQLYAKGIELRDIVKGRDIKTKKQQECRTNEFLVAEIDAKFGGYGIVPESLEGAIVSNHYFLYEINYAKLLPEFLGLYIKTSEFHRQIQAVGSTNYAAIRSYQVLEYKIPLPPLSVQQQLVSDYHARMKQAADADVKANDLEKGIETYLLTELGIEIRNAETQEKKGLQFVKFKDVKRWGIEFLINAQEKPLFSKKFDIINLSSIVWINPKISFSELTSEAEITFIPMETISDKYGELTEYRTTKVANSRGYTKIEDGCLIWAKITPCMENGKSAVVKNLKNRFACGSTEFHVFKAKDERLDIEYLYVLFRTEYLKQIAKKHFTGSAGQQRVPSLFFNMLEIPLPPLSVQTAIISHINEQKTAFEHEVFEQ